HETVAVGVVPRPVYLAVEFAQCLPQAALHASERLPAVQTVAIRAAVRTAATGPRDSGVADLVRVERGVPVGFALHVQEAVRHLLVVAVECVWTPRGGPGGGGSEHHLVVLGGVAQLPRRRVLELQEDRRDPEDAR